MLDVSGVTLSRSQGVKTGVSIKFICGVMYYPRHPAPSSRDVSSKFTHRIN